MWWFYLNALVIGLLHHPTSTKIQLVVSHHDIICWDLLLQALSFCCVSVSASEFGSCSSGSCGTNLSSRNVEHVHRSSLHSLQHCSVALVMPNASSLSLALTVCSSSCFPYRTFLANTARSLTQVWLPPEIFPEPHFQPSQTTNLQL